MIDTTATLAEIRALAARYHEVGASLNKDATAAWLLTYLVELVAQVEVLDAELSAGRPVPADWIPAVAAAHPVSTWAEYQIICADDQARHVTPSKSDRVINLQATHWLDRHGCGPHLLRQRTVTATEWGPLQDGPDPQTLRRDGFLRWSERVPCPKCKAAAGNRCEDLRARKRGEKVTTRWPHRERIEGMGAKRS